MQLRHSSEPKNANSPFPNSTGTNWQGRPGDEHATNRTDELDVQSGASQGGKRSRESGDENGSQATTEKDSGNQNEQAKKDHPEAPGPVIGMNDERGQMGHKK